VKAALIPPIPELKVFGGGSFHLLLSHLLKRRPYWRHYFMQRQAGAYLVLDNSAHEYEFGENPDVLLKQAMELNCQEVVVPDRLEDASSTIDLAMTAFESWCEAKSAFLEFNPALMYVPQAKTREEWKACLHELTRLHVYASRKHRLRRDFVIGVSKDYEVWDGGIRFLLGAYLLPLREVLSDAGIKMHVHLLGWGRKLWNLHDLANTYPWIRSTDSAKPFVYAMKNTYLDPNLPPPVYPRRPRGYFGKRLSYEARDIARLNVEVFRDVAAGKMRASRK
jgi:hypothetical protein